MRILSGVDNLTYLFCDLVEIGLDFFELLRIYCDNGFLPYFGDVQQPFTFPHPDRFCNLDQKDIRRGISRWTGSKYRSASIDAVVLEIYHHIADRHIGSYVYHSNRNPKNIKAADDIYVLFVFSSSATFIDLNKKKSYTLDYVVGFSVSMIIGQSQDIFHGFELMMKTGTIRTIYTVINKALQVSLFFLLGAQYEKIRQFDKRYLGILFGITTSCYIIMSILLSLIMTDSLFVMQIAIVVSWIFIMSCLVAIITIISIHSKYIKKERETVMISLTNELMERNYQQLHKNQRLIAKQVHDFTNHLKTLKGMLDKDTEAEQYVGKLLAITYRESKLCHSGCDVIDAIINCKVSEATAGHIAFTYKVQLPEPIHISSVDICAVLSNQIDNALEACANIPNQQERFVQVTLWQKETFLFFKVINSVLVNPFIAGNTLISKKKESGHGLGLINIRDTVEKYNGTLDNQFSGNQFISIAMMQNTL